MDKPKQKNNYYSPGLKFIQEDIFDSYKYYGQCNYRLNHGAWGHHYPFHA